MVLVYHSPPERDQQGPARARFRRTFILFTNLLKCLGLQGTLSYKNQRSKSFLNGRIKSERLNQEKQAPVNPAMRVCGLYEECEK